MAALEEPRVHLLRTIRDQRDHYQRQADSLQARQTTLGQTWGSRYQYDVVVIDWSREYVRLADAVLDTLEKASLPTAESVRV